MKHAARVHAAVFAARLVGAQVALSLVLLTGSGLFVRSLAAAMKVPLGFKTQGVAPASVNLNLVRYDDARSRGSMTRHWLA